MRLTTTRLAVPLILLVLAGCGGTQVVVNDVPGGPVDLKVPGNGEGLAGAPTPTPTAGATEEPTDATDDTAQAEPTAAPTEAPADTSTQTDPAGGAQAPETDTGTGTATGEPPEAGAPKKDFEDYCAQNPGAC